MTLEYMGWRVRTLTFQNGTRLVETYDALRRVAQHRWESFNAPKAALGSGDVLVGFGYTYDRANNRLSQEKLHDPGNSELYSYRSDYELTSFARGTLNATKTAILTPSSTAGALQNQTWSLDGSGNWTANTHTTGGVTGTENRTSSNVNEIATLSGDPYGSNVPATYQFDANGNLLDDGKLLYKWDALNRLQQVFRKSDGLLIADYSYASDNRRFRKIVTNGGLDGSTPNGTTDFYWSGWQTIEERDALDLTTQQYVYGLALNDLWTLDDRRAGITIAQLNDGTADERKFYHTDVLGSVYALTNETGQILVGFQYDAYGLPTEFGSDMSGVVTFGSNVVLVGTTVPANPYGYAGYRLDGETKVYYVNWRYYSADQARFLSRDPVKGWNLYVYVGNRPVGTVDPSGLQAQSDPASTTVHPERQQPTEEQKKKIIKDPNFKAFLGGTIEIKFDPKKSKYKVCCDEIVHIQNLRIWTYKKKADGTNDYTLVTDPSKIYSYLKGKATSQGYIMDQSPRTGSPFIQDSTGAGGTDAPRQQVGSQNEDGSSSTPANMVDSPNTGSLKEQNLGLLVYFWAFPCCRKGKDKGKIYDGGVWWKYDSPPGDDPATITVLQANIAEPGPGFMEAYRNAGSPCSK